MMKLAICHGKNSLAKLQMVFTIGIGDMRSSCEYGNLSKSFHLRKRKMIMPIEKNGIFSRTDETISKQ